MSNTNKRFTALYARLSKEDGKYGTSNSISHQMSIMHDYAEANGFENVLEYADDGFSGTNFDRPGFLTMKEDIERGLIGTVIIKDLSRLGRDHIDSGILIERFFPEHNVRFISIIERVDSDDPSSMSRVAYNNVYNEEYARGVSNKMRFTIENKGKNGNRITTRAIYGYAKDTNDNTKWVIDEPADKYVRIIFNMYVDGNSVSKIAHTLFEMKALRPSDYHNNISPETENDEAFKWSLQTITSILGKREYCGDTVNFRTTRKSFKSKEVIHNDSDKILIFNDSHPAIIDRDIFAKAQERLSQRKRVKRIDDAPVFADLVYCADCKCRMHIMRTSSKRDSYTAYVCGTYRKNSKACGSHYIRAEQLGNEIVDIVSNIVNGYRTNPAAFRAKVAKSLTDDEVIYHDSLLAQISETEETIELYSMYLQRCCERYFQDIIGSQALAVVSRRFTDIVNELNKKLVTLKRQEAEQSNIIGKTELFFKKLDEVCRNEITVENAVSLIERIEVYEGKKVSGRRKKYNKIDVYFIGVGLIND